MIINTRLDCHMHSTFSDGSATIDQMAKSAIEKGLETIAITDHMPLPFKTRYAMDLEQIGNYRDAIQKAARTHKQNLTILSGMEMEYIPGHEQWVKNVRDLGWDMLLISVHQIATHQGVFLINGREDDFRQTLTRAFRNDFQAFCREYYALVCQAASTGWFDAVGHLDVLKKHNLDNKYFDEKSDWYRELIHDTLDTIAGAGMKMEINTNGLHHAAAAPYPSYWIIREAMKRNIPLILGSDAHHPQFQGQHFDLVAAEIAKIRQQIS
ncbi:histidinol-phosphatase HisJ [uncultured Desulfobacter sp.]|uniref:histidinol-phosphatase HisJ n=1 Tax=uncultured Desulfobacter sp. TaxID=240139 RepID=UPI002AAAEF15|nr:histidinol-phosphatase HisJ [uncultured Desulfobacter sp.]